RFRGERALHYPRHCEQSEAIQLTTLGKNGLLRRFAPRNDEESRAYLATPSLRAKRSNPAYPAGKEWIASSLSLLAMTKREPRIRDSRAVRPWPLPPWLVACGEQSRAGS